MLSEVGGVAASRAAAAAGVSPPASPGHNTALSPKTCPQIGTRYLFVGWRCRKQLDPHQLVLGRDRVTSPEVLVRVGIKTSQALFDCNSDGVHGRSCHGQPPHDSSEGSYRGVCRAHCTTAPLENHGPQPQNLSDPCARNDGFWQSECFNFYFREQAMLDV